MNKKIKLHILLSQIRNILVYFCLLLLIIYNTPVAAQSNKIIKRVLVTFSSSPELPTSLLFAKGFKERMNNESTFDVEYMFEYFELPRRIKSVHYPEHLAAFLTEKYKDNPPDLVVHQTRRYSTIFLKYKEIFPNAPILLSGDVADGVEQLKLPENYSVVLSYYNFDSAFTTILKIQPGTKKVYFVIGNSEFEKEVTKKATERAAAFSDKLNVEFLNMLKLDEIIDKLKNAENNSVIYFFSFSTEANGQTTFPAMYVINKIKEAAHVPIYGAFDQFLELGSMGGFMYSNEMLGRYTAEKGIEIMKGIYDKNQPVKYVSICRNIFNWKELKRYNIDDSNIPEGSTVQGKVYTFWELYGNYVKGGLLFVTLETLLILLLFYNIRHRKRMENEIIEINRNLEQTVEERTKELKESEQDFRLLIDNNPFPIVIVERENNNIIYYNKPAADYFDIPQDRTKILTTEDLFKDNDDTENGFLKKMEEDGEVNNFELKYTNITGKKHTSLISSRNVRFEGKNCRISSVIDITERKLTEEKLHELNATKDKFFSILAHDLRSPIGNMASFIDMMSRMSFEDLKIDYRENLEILKNSSAKTFELLETLLLWGKSQRDNIEYKPERNSLKSLIEDIISLFRAASKAKNIKITTVFKDELIAYFDTDMMNTIVRNLINNALKYSYDNSEIVISGRRVNGNTEICVKDTGTGMDKETIANLFRIDVQNKSEIGTRGEKGSGLGLILCKEFVEKHKGKIWVESEQGKGSSVGFSIPDEERKD